MKNRNKGTTKTSPQVKPRMRISDDLQRYNTLGGNPTLEQIEAIYRPAVTLGFSADSEKHEEYIAQDSALKHGGYYSLILHSFDTVAFNALPQFVGYGILSGLTQNGLIRFGVEMISNEMTREWIDLKRSGDSSDAIGEDRIEAIGKELQTHDIRTLFKDAMDMCGYYGGCLVYIDTGESDPARLKQPLILTRDTFGRGSLRGFKVIEPFLVAPGTYDSSRPWSKHYFKPQSWWVLGQEIHASRFLHFSINPVPTVLKPAYNFFGIPTAQIVLDVVDHFTSCREAAARLLEKFSMTVFKTDMSGLLQGGGREDLDRRIQFMVDNRDNDAIIAINAGDINTGGEDIIKLETPIGGVTDIVRQAMEMVAAYFNEPVVKLWGISPSGFNASGEVDLANHYDHIKTLQNAVFRKNLETIIKIIQLNLYGDFDSSITFDFNPLNKDDERTIAEVQKIKADGDAVLISAGVISQEEARARLAGDPDSGYNSIDIDAVPMVSPEYEI